MYIYIYIYIYARTRTRGPETLVNTFAYCKRCTGHLDLDIQSCLTLLVEHMFSSKHAIIGEHVRIPQALPMTLGLGQ